MKAHLLTIGDELLIGQTTNTNAAWLGESLSQMGVRVDRSVVVGDTAEAIRTELDRAFADVPLVITTGGLGPTHDDVTKTVVAEYFDTPLESDPDLLARVRNYYERRDREMPSDVAALADVPAGFEQLQNPVGTAVGLWYADETDGRERILVVLPGVPQEMKQIFSASVAPRLKERADLLDVTHRTLLTSGIGESDLQEEIGDLSGVLEEDLSLAYLPSTSGVRLRLTAHGADTDSVRERLDALEATLRERAGRHIFGTGDDTLEGVVGAMLRKRGLVLATAESATGGMIGHRITGVAGSSDYFAGGVVAYSNRLKQHLLGVSTEDLAVHGAVSEPVAVQMARGARTAAATAFDAFDDPTRDAAPNGFVGVSTTGVAGPGGGTPEKPVGTVWVGFSYRDVDGSAPIEYARRLQFLQDRTLNKELFSTSAIEMIRRQLQRLDA